MLWKKFYWSQILSLIMQMYLSNTTICIIWHDDFDLSLASDIGAAIVNINLHQLEASFERDIVNFTAKREELLSNFVSFNTLVEKLVMSIEKSHCECFISFQEDIPIFIEAFENASRYSIWRSKRNKFIFAYNREKMLENYFTHSFFEEHPQILVVEGSTLTPHIFNLETNKFVGPRTDNPGKLYLLDRYNAEDKYFYFGAELFPDKLKDLQGREVVLAAFDYKPDIILKYYAGAPTRDKAFAPTDRGGDVEIDGTEARILMTFCEKYNCTLVIDTSEADDWGVAYLNMTGESTLGMIAKGNAEVGMSAMYSWYPDYRSLDMSIYLGRSGVTCVVPAPKRLASWLLPMEPFQPALWLFVIVCLCIEIVALLLIHHLESTITAPGEREGKRIGWWRNFHFALTMTMKLFVSQGNNIVVTFTPIRVMLFACFLNDIVITSIYGGGLASILTVPRVTGLLFLSSTESGLNIDSLTLVRFRILLLVIGILVALPTFNTNLFSSMRYIDLAISTNMFSTKATICFEPAADSLERMYSFKLKWAGDSVAWIAGILDDESEIIRGVLANFRAYGEEELAVLAQQAQMGFTIERLPFGHFAVEDHLTHSVLDRMKTMIDDIYFQYTVAFTSRLWPMLERFDNMILMWHSSGFDKFWEWRNVADNLDGQIQKQLAASMYINLDDKGPEKLGMSNFAGILLLWCLGICFAMIVFTAELILYRLKAGNNMWGSVSHE